MPHRVSESEYRRLAKQPEPAPPAKVPPTPKPSGSGRVTPSSPRSVPARSSPKGENYWGFSLTMIGVLLIAYLAGRGQLTTLINVLIPKASDAPAFGGAKQAPGGSYAPGTTQVPGSGSGVAATPGGGAKFLQGDPAKGIPGESDQAGPGNIIGGVTGAIKGLKDWVGGITGIFQ